MITRTDWDLLVAHSSCVREVNHNSWTRKNSISSLDTSLISSSFPTLFMTSFISFLEVHSATKHVMHLFTNYDREKYYRRIVSYYKHSIEHLVGRLTLETRRMVLRGIFTLATAHQFRQQTWCAFSNLHAKGEDARGYIRNARAWTEMQDCGRLEGIAG